MPESGTYGSGAARLAAIPAGESPASTRSPVHAVVISSGSEGDRSAESLEVKALWCWGDPVRSVTGGEQLGRPQRNANQEAPKYVPRAKRIAGTLGVPSRSDLGEGQCRHRRTGPQR
jgi:hypothetical protein